MLQKKSTHAEECYKKIHICSYKKIHICTTTVMMINMQSPKSVFAGATYWQTIYWGLPLWLRYVIHSHSHIIPSPIYIQSQQLGWCVVERKVYCLEEQTKENKGYRLRVRDSGVGMWRKLQSIIHSTWRWIIIKFIVWICIQHRYSLQRSTHGLHLLT